MKKESNIEFKRHKELEMAEKLRLNSERERLRIKSIEEKTAEK